MELTGRDRLNAQLQQIRRADAEYVAKLKAEDKLPVRGNEALAPYLGDVYTYSHNGYTVTIRLDGTLQYYPESIAKHLDQKLADISKSKRAVSETKRIG